MRRGLPLTLHSILGRGGENGNISGAKLNFSVFLSFSLSSFRGNMGKMRRDYERKEREVVYEEE